MERSMPIEDLLESTISTQFSDYIKHFSNEELTKEYLFSENTDLNLFHKLLHHLKEMIVGQDLIYGHTKQGLRVIRSILQ